MTEAQRVLNMSNDITTALHETVGPNMSVRVALTVLATMIASYYESESSQEMMIDFVSDQIRKTMAVHKLKNMRPLN